MFIRVKRIKGQPYAYQVTNEWTAKGPRQKVTSYLGRVIELQPASPSRQRTESPLQGSTPSELIRSAVEQELLQFGFKLQPRQEPQVIKVEPEKKKTRTKQTRGQGSNTAARAIDQKDNREQEFWTRDDLTVSLERRELRCSGRKIVLAMNEGFLCDATLTDVLDYKPCEGKTEQELGQELASRLLEAGLQVKQQEFVRLFSALFPQVKFYQGSDVSEKHWSEFL